MRVLVAVLLACSCANAWEMVIGESNIVARAAQKVAISSPSTTDNATPTTKAAIQLEQPIKCTLDEDCWAVNNVDFGRGCGAKDYMCQNKTYNGHKGVDFAIRDMEAMRQGVDVVAAAAGEIKAVRDGMSDISVRERGIASVKDVECGNGIVIAHVEGWETQYCHLKKGSIIVKTGQKITAGEKLGQVGLSGRTEYPHLHLSVRHNGRTVDPSYGDQDVCGKTPIPMWAGKLKLYPFHRTGNIYNFGFSIEKPNATKMREGLYRKVNFTKDAPMLIGWADIFNVDQGDIISIEITQPNGSILTKNTIEIKKYQARYFIFAGKKQKGGNWPSGKYQLKITYTSKRTGDIAIKHSEIFA